MEPILLFLLIVVVLIAVGAIATWAISKYMPSPPANFINLAIWVVIAIVILIQLLRTFNIVV